MRGRAGGSEMGALLHSPFEPAEGWPPRVIKEGRQDHLSPAGPGMRPPSSLARARRPGPWEGSGGLGSPFPT